MGANCRRIIACCFGGQGKLIIETPLYSFSILLNRKKYLSGCFFKFVSSQSVGQGAIWRQIMWGEMSSIIHTGKLWV